MKFIYLLMLVFLTGILHLGYALAQANLPASRRFLPIKIDPSHEAEVLHRLEGQVESFSLPASFEIPKNELSPIRDQGNRGTCAYFSTLGALEYYYRSSTSNNNKIDLSVECLADVRNWEFDNHYSGSETPLTRPDPDGDLFDSIVQTIYLHGVPFTKNYGSQKLDCEYYPTMSMGSPIELSKYEGIFSSNSSYAYGKGIPYQVDRAPSIAKIKDFLARKIPVVVGILVYSEFPYQIDWRYNPAIDGSSNSVGGHAILLTGYSGGSGDKTIFTFRNSWGVLWGNDGYGTIDARLLIHSWSFEKDFDSTLTIH